MRRGMSLMLVTLVVAAATVVAWAVLSVSTRNSMIEGNRAAAVEARYAAESGVSLGMYYLENPDQAPRLAEGTHGAIHFPGETGIELLGTDSAVDITVTNTGRGEFLVESVAQTPVGESAAIGRAYAHLRVRTESGTSTDALLVNGSLTLPRGMTVTGDLVSDGTISRLNVSDRSTVTVSAPPVLTYDQLPIIQQLANAPDSSGTTDRTYIWRGRSYRAQVLPSKVSGTLSGDPVTNPANVWYTESSVTLRDLNMTGTIVVRSAHRSSELIIEGDTRIRAVLGMPAMVVGNDLTLGNGSNLEVDGAVWVGRCIKTLGLLMRARMTIRGALLLPSGSFMFAGNANSPIDVIHDASAQEAEGLRAPLARPEITAVSDVHSRVN
jgi:hypothetical protein